MENAYAQALWKMVERGMDHKKAVNALRETLREHGRESLLPRIGRAFARIAARDAKKNDLVLTIAEEKGEAAAKRDAKEVLKDLGIEGDLKTQVDDALIGGWRLEGRGVLVDSSYKKQLLEIYNRSIA